MSPLADTWHLFRTSQQHRINLFCILRDSLSNVLRQLPCLLKHSPLQTKCLQFLQMHFSYDTVSAFFTVFLQMSLPWALSKGSCPFLSDTHTDQSLPGPGACLLVHLVFLSVTDTSFETEGSELGADGSVGCVLCLELWDIPSLVEYLCLVYNRAVFHLVALDMSWIPGKWLANKWGGGAEAWNSSSVKWEDVPVFHFSCDSCTLICFEKQLW